MRLKQLEIKGFKSFAKQTVINFEEDVIGIVGPNGSGKSNIVDAIRWVLGEQKGKELRLDKMSSVIFNGTKKRKAGNVAQVSLTFENTKNLLPTEYNMVTITRMLYRSGESEYQLNGVKCRLKDVRSLFLDTGIGSNSYAIIALGMVDDILADKDNSRRRMFEQAAGVSKYKVRKRETMNKLKLTEGDLDRIEDLLHEINTNLVSLEKQAKRARRYREIKAQYRDLSLQLAGFKVSDLRRSKAQLDTQIAQAEDQYRATDIKIKQLEAQLEQERKQNVDQEKLLSERQRELNEMVNKLRAQENDKQMLAQRLNFLAETRRNLEDQIEQAASQIKLLDGQILELKGRIEEETATEQELGQGLKASEQALNEIRTGYTGIKSQLDAGMQQQQTLEREIFELEKQRAINANQIDNFRHQRERNLADMEDRSGEQEALTARLAKIEKEEAVKLRELEALETEEETRRKSLEAGEDKLDTLKTEFNKVNRKLDAKRNEYKLTKSMVENLEGFPESIRFLSQSRQWSEKAQLLSDLLLVDEAYRVAIENYLESYLNYYVVPDLGAAREAIQLLSKGQKGKANFFLLDAIGKAPPPAALLPAGARSAAEVVQVDPAYRSLIDHLLHGVLVTDSDEMPDGSTDGYTILARSGRFIRRPQSVSGGSVGLFEGKKIGRKKNLELLEKVIEQAEAEAEALDEKLYHQRNANQQLRQRRIASDIQAKQRELNALQQSRAALRAQVDNVDAWMNETQAKNQELEQQSIKLTESNKQGEKTLQQKQQEVEELREKLAGTDGNYRKLSEELSAASNEYNTQNIGYIRQQNLVESLQKELDFRENRRKELQTQSEQNKLRAEQIGEETTEIQRKQLELGQELERKYLERRTYEQGLNEVEQAYFAARKAGNDLEDQLRKVNRQRQDNQILVNQLKDKGNDLKFELGSLTERLRVEFNVELADLTMPEPDEPPKMPQAEMQLKVDRLRSRIANYGEINPMAVEAYDEMKERFDTISGQRDDIIEAKHSLIETIKEIEETATLQFLEAFDQVRINFIDVFRSLFTEDDNCDLILLDPENPLESGIEIVAKPKGKRPQSISQLSGGEKTLTATALLFALYLLKPAPFCIFDEVDAPLDDANIAKFNRIIKKFSYESQFIIVTHNKLTMEAVDTVYGVAMPETGVSTVLPVDFREFEGKATFEAVN
ncbi:MAG: chromosome segregation protein SMC [Bacteroidota bacterium]